MSLFAPTRLATRLFLMLPGLSLAAAHAQAPEATNPCPIDADIWVLAGQSNMVGAEMVTESTPEDERLYMLNLDGRWMPAQEPVHRYYEATVPAFRLFMLSTVATPEARAEMEVALDSAREASLKKPIGGYGPGLPFARSVLAATGRPIGLIPCAQGSTAMANWDPAQKDKGLDTHYGLLLHRIREVGGQVKGVLWYQGESETNLPDTYEATFLNFIDALRRDSGLPDLPIICAQLGRFFYIEDKSPGWEKVREVQRRVATMRDHVYVVPAGDLPMTDHIHVSRAGQERLGRRMAETALTHVYGLPDHGTPIDFESMKVVNRPNGQATIGVHFSGVTGKLGAAGEVGGFELRGGKANPIPVVVFYAELDPADPSGVILHVAAPITEPVQLVYGGGMNPRMNLRDERDMAVPAFGPLDVPAGVSE